MQPVAVRTRHAAVAPLMSALCLFAAAVPAALQAQDVVFPGSTVQGDILRGQGQFLKGAAMYDLYSARGRAIDTQTAIIVEKWNEEVYNAYMRERAAHIQYRRNASKAEEEQARRHAEEREKRLRTNPTDEDVIRGDALNALLLDLSNPAISSPAWRSAPVPLPDGISVRSLFFRFAPKLGDTTSLNSSLIALGRLDPEKGWPIFIPEETLGVERRAYEAAYRELLALCEKDKLTLGAVSNLDAALAALKAKVSRAVPADRNFRTEAVRFIADMRTSTQIFNASTINFAQEMIRDTHEYKAQTVGELLAFMRKYRLLFASAEGRPRDGEIYRRLYGALRQQKEKLNLPIVDTPSVSPQMANAVAELLNHLADIVKNELPTAKNNVYPHKREALEKIRQQVKTAGSSFHADVPISDEQIVRLHQIIADLRLAIENPDPDSKIANPTAYAVIKHIITTIDSDLRKIKTLR
jgi:hypothetical protein